jgi:hypothetical protein
MLFDPASAGFQMTFTANTAIQQPTLIYLNEAMWYPNGYTVAISPSGAATWTSPETNRISVSFSSQAKNGAKISITITAK